MRIARATRDIIYPDNSWMGDGRPKGSGTAQEKVQQFRAEHPEATKAECIRVTGLSKPTVYKWWDA